MKSTRQAAIDKIDHIGKYLVKTRNLHSVCALSAVQAAHTNNPDAHCLSILAVALAAISGAKDDGWVTEIKATLGFGGER